MPLPPDTEVVRVRTWATMSDEGIRALVMRAAEKALPWATPRAVYGELRANVASDKLGIFVGFKHRLPLALAVASLPTTTFMMGPTVAVIYSESEPALIRKVGMKVGAWLAAHGHEEAYGLNLKHSDEAMIRGLSSIGDAAVEASLVRCKFPQR